MDGRLIFLHHPWRLMASGRWLEGERPARRGRPARARAFTIPKSSEGQTRKADAGRSSVPVLKLTQVGEMNILRRSRERS